MLVPVDSSKWVCMIVVSIYSNCDFVCAGDVFVCAYRASLIRSHINSKKNQINCRVTVTVFPFFCCFYSFSLSLSLSLYASAFAVARASFTITCWTLNNSIRFIQHLLNHITCYLRDPFFLYSYKQTYCCTARNYVRNGLSAGLAWRR